MTASTLVQHCNTTAATACSTLTREPSRSVMRSNSAITTYLPLNSRRKTNCSTPCKPSTAPLHVQPPPPTTNNSLQSRPCEKSYTVTTASNQRNCTHFQGCHFQGCRHQTRSNVQGCRPSHPHLHQPQPNTPNGPWYHTATERGHQHQHHPNPLHNAHVLVCRMPSRPSPSKMTTAWTTATAPTMRPTLQPRQPLTQC